MCMSQQVSVAMEAHNLNWYSYHHNTDTPKLDIRTVSNQRQLCVQRQLLLGNWIYIYSYNTRSFLFLKWWNCMFTRKYILHHILKPIQ